MGVILVLLIGIIIGYLILPKNNKVLLEILKYLQLICTLVLIFTMGVNLAREPNFIDNLLNLGVTSLILCLIPTICSIIVVFFLVKKFIYKKKESEK